MKKNKHKEIKTLNDLEKGSFFYEELGLMKAQEVIAQALEETGMRRVDLARKIGKTKPDITRMLSTGRNLTIRSLNRVLFHLGRELVLSVRLIHQRRFKNIYRKYAYNFYLMTHKPVIIDFTTKIEKNLARNYYGQVNLPLSYNKNKGNPQWIQ